MRTARSRTSGENFDFLMMAPCSQMKEPPRKAGRFKMKLHGSFKDVVWMVTKSLSETDTPIQSSLNPDIRLVRVVRYLNGLAR